MSDKAKGGDDARKARLAEQLRANLKRRKEQTRAATVLNGTIPISGAKNAALPLMIASLLTSETLTLDNVPRLADVEQLIGILGNHGVDHSVNGRREGQDTHYGRTIHFTRRQTSSTPPRPTNSSRDARQLLGDRPAAGAHGRGAVSLPGGCAIGTRPVDLFIEGLKALGAEIEIESGYVVRQGAQGADRRPRSSSPRSRSAAPMC
jgi:UDP-N-acetylglucosamine 1-carboxyvinyltransferase